MKQLRLLFLICLCCTTGSLMAQSPDLSNPGGPQQKVAKEREMCKTTVTPATIQMEMNRNQQAYRQLLQQYLNKPSTRAITTFTVQLHIVTRDDGTGGIPVADIRNEFTNWVNPYFAQIDVQFEECSPENYINSSAWYSLSGDAEGDAMSLANNVANVINIYFVDDPDGACGWARFPWMLPSDYIVLANGCATNQSTLVHELGHYFGLYHTHETAFGAESVTRNSGNSCYDCEDEGDKLCDTDADPRLNRNDVTISNSCVYSASLTDECGISYTPDEENIMSYSLKACRIIFSAQQKAKMTLTAISPSGSPLFGRSYCSNPVLVKNLRPFARIYQSTLTVKEMPLSQLPRSTMALPMIAAWHP